MTSPLSQEALPQSFSFEGCSTVPHHHVGQKLALVMVGLPARGKTYIARRLARHLSWLGFPVRVFNVSNYRRMHIGTSQLHTFFDENNLEASDKRWKVAMHALDDMITYFTDGGLISIYDATNVTREKRAKIKIRLENQGIKVMFIESICETPEIIEAHLQASKDLPDYLQIEPSAASSDFLLRIDQYRKVYAMLTKEEAVSYIQVIDSGEQVVLHRIAGYLEGRIAHFVINMNIEPREIYRPIYFSRHGQSVYNLHGKIGGDSSLYETGQQFSHKLADFMISQQKQLPADPNERSLESKGWEAGSLQVWTSSLVRTIQTAAPLQALGACGLVRQWRCLDEIDAGICDGMTYEEIEEKMPEEFTARSNDKLRYRYPKGESYVDVIHRVEPVILELERTSVPTLIIGHQAVLRALIAYFLERSQSDIPFIEVPLHTVLKILPSAVGCKHKAYKLL